jgi:predicted outer membrane protein
VAEEARTLLAQGKLASDSAILQFLRAVPSTANAIEIDAARFDYAERIASGQSHREALKEVAKRFERDQRAVAGWLELLHY